MTADGAKGKVYFECVLRGALMQVSAIDAATGTEVKVFGPAASREALLRNAAAKLAFVMKKNKP